jgi:regulator of protease activity HflC (stomatin/prohibitin superfamily)
LRSPREPKDCQTGHIDAGVADRSTAARGQHTDDPPQAGRRPHTLDEALADTELINANIRQILDMTALEWGVEVALVELKDIQLPDSMKRAMARQAAAEREKRENHCHRR